MIRVTNTLFFDKSALESDRRFSEKLGPGLLVTLDGENRLDADGKPILLVKPGSTVRIHRPDGSVIDRVVNGVEIWGHHAGFFFSKTEPQEIPISSQIELPA